MTSHSSEKDDFIHIFFVREFKSILIKLAAFFEAYLYDVCPRVLFVPRIV